MPTATVFVTTLKLPVVPMLKHAIIMKMRPRMMAPVQNLTLAAYAVVLVSQEMFAIAMVIFWTNAECAVAMVFQKELAIAMVTSQ